MRMRRLWQQHSAAAKMPMQSSSSDRLWAWPSAILDPEIKHGGKLATVLTPWSSRKESAKIVSNKIYNELGGAQYLSKNLLQETGSIAGTKIIGEWR